MCNGCIGRRVGRDLKKVNVETANKDNGIEQSEEDRVAGSFRSEG